MVKVELLSSRTGAFTDLKFGLANHPSVAAAEHVY